MPCLLRAVLLLSVQLFQVLWQFSPLGIGTCSSLDLLSSGPYQKHHQQGWSLSAGSQEICWGWSELIWARQTNPRYGNRQSHWTGEGWAEVYLVLCTIRPLDQASFYVRRLGHLHTHCKHCWAILCLFWLLLIICLFFANFVWFTGTIGILGRQNKKIWASSAYPFLPFLLVYLSHYLPLLLLSLQSYFHYLLDYIICILNSLSLDFSFWIPSTFVLLSLTLCGSNF